MDVLQPLVENFMVQPPQRGAFPYSDSGDALIQAVRTLCTEHERPDITRHLDTIAAQQVAWERGVRRWRVGVVVE
jgi:hypothetical protein